MSDRIRYCVEGMAEEGILTADTTQFASSDKAKSFHNLNKDMEDSIIKRSPQTLL